MGFKKIWRFEPAVGPVSQGGPDGAMPVCGNGNNTDERLMALGLAPAPPVGFDRPFLLFKTGFTFFEKQTGPTTQAQAELQRGFIMAKAFRSDLYCTLPGEQYKLQMTSLLRPIEEIGTEDISRAEALSYAAIVDRMVDMLFVPLIRTLSSGYGVSVHMATRGSGLDRALTEIESFVFKRSGELWQESDSPAFRQRVSGHVTRSIASDQVAWQRIEAPFMYILYHFAVPFSAFGRDALTGQKKVLKLKTKGMGEISSTIAAWRLARDLGLTLDMVMLTQPYVPTPHSVSKQAKTFDMVSLPDTLKCFPIVIEQLSALIQA